MASGLENIETIESPFRRFVTTIGVFPTAFTDAMTYYECLAYLVKYMEDTMIPAINENAEAVEELQGLYIQLKAFVDNYFDNLDVQEEINNKLDQMVEDGTLQEIITQYIQANTAWYFNTVADMKAAENLTNGSFAHTLGYHFINDGGEATYKIRTITNEDVVDDASIIAVHDDSLIAELVNFAEINVKQYGAYGDNTHDDTSIIQHAIDKANDTHGIVYIPTGEYKISDTIEITKRIKIYGDYEIGKANDDKIIGTHIRQTGNANIFEFKTANNYGTEISKLRLSGNSNSAGIYCDILVSEFIIEKVHFNSQFNECIHLTNATIGRISDCDFSENTTGINIVKGVALEICFNNFWNNTTDIKIGQLQGCHVFSNWAESTSADSVGLLFQAPCNVLYSDFDNNSFQKVTNAVLFDATTNITSIMYFRTLKFSNSRFTGTKPIEVDYINDSNVKNTTAGNRSDVIFDNCLFNNATSGYGITTDYELLRWTINDCVALTGWTSGNASIINTDLSHNFAIVNSEYTGFKTNGCITLETLTDNDLRANNSFYIHRTSGDLMFRDNNTKDQRVAYLESGNTANRPTNPRHGEMYYDSTLIKPIWWSGAAWVDATGKVVS